MAVLAIRFLVELWGVIALGYVGANTGTDPGWRLVLGLGAPALLLVVWALLVAPKARNPVPHRLREVIGTALLVFVAAALAGAGQPGWGTALAALTIVDQILILGLNVGRPTTALGVAAAGGGR